MPSSSEKNSSPTYSNEVSHMNALNGAQKIREKHTKPLPSANSDVVVCIIIYI